VITGKTKIYFMIAHPIDHVRSPEVFNPLFVADDIDAVMVPLHFHPENFAAGWDAIRRMENVGGLIVSVPFKEEAYRLCDERDESASDVGMANVIRREPDGRFVGANFDGLGFMSGLLNEGKDAVGKSVLLVGTGGAGAAIAFALAKAGVKEIVLSDTNEARAGKLAQDLITRFADLPVRVGPPDPTGSNLVINATPCGLHPETDPLPLMIDKLTGDMTVADIIMKPRITPLLKAAEQTGCDIRLGEGMLERQSDHVMRFFRRQQLDCEGLRLS
jgi:shikimate dehydrogenase